MSLKEIVKKIFQQLPVIYMGSMMGTLIYCIIFDPDSVFTLDYFAQMLLFSFLAAVPVLVFYAKEELSEKKMRIRLLVHFLTLSTEILIMAYILGLYHTLIQGCFFFLLICGVYVLVWLSVFNADKKTATTMNEKIKERKAQQK